MDRKRAEPRTATVWQYGLGSFQTGGTKLERFLPKNQHTQRKSLNFENWINRGFRSFQKKIRVLKVNNFNLLSKNTSNWSHGLTLLLFLFFNNKIKHLHQFSEKKSIRGFKSCCLIFKSFFALKHYQNFIIH